MKTGCIYRIWRGDMSYVGQTLQDPATRIRAHFTQGGCPRLSNAIQKHGADEFQHEILEADIPADALDEREIYWIQHFNSVSPNGYNLTYGGESGLRSIETRDKISEANKGRFPSEETLQKLSASLKGKPKSPEHRRKLSEANLGKCQPDSAVQRTAEANRGKRRSPETRQKISDGKKGQPSPLKGKPISEEHKQKISEAQKGKPRSPETRQKISEGQKGKSPWNKGRLLSESHRRKLSEARKGKRLSATHKRKISLAKTGKPSPLKGRTLSEAHKRKIAKALHRSMSEARQRKPGWNRANPDVKKSSPLQLYLFED